MNAIPVIAIFDVGRTNKKVFLFDEEYSIVYERTDKFPETRDEDGDPCEDLGLLTRWCIDTFEKLMQLPGFSIRAVNFSAYGASFVHLGEDGMPILPLYSYLKPYPAGLKKRFFDSYGGELAVSMNTASPILDSLNSGLQLYRLKFEKDLLAHGGYSLHLPQYISYLITRRFFSDITSIGCHTMLWDFPYNRYHEWVQKENIAKRLAPIFPGDEVVAVPGLSNLMAGAGLHDSSSALIPYLSGFHQPFVLISTGTWCISVNPFNESPLTAQELKHDCLCFLTYRGNPVKASRIFAGHEHEVRVRALAEYFHKPGNYFETVVYNSDIVKRLPDRTGQVTGEDYSSRPYAFKQRDPAGFDSYEEAYHQLMMDIMHEQVGSTQLVMQGMTVSRLFVDGGFSKNPVYMNLLAQAFPGAEVFAASVAQSTAIGAALAIHRHWNTRDVPSDLIDLKHYASARV